MPHPAALRFYRVHADVDPVHGKNWVDNAVVPLIQEHPDWGPRIVTGAWWRSVLSESFFPWAAHSFAATRPTAPGPSPHSPEPDTIGAPKLSTGECASRQ